jgi:uncharacterized membrane protein
MFFSTLSLRSWLTLATLILVSILGNILNIPLFLVLIFYGVILQLCIILQRYGMGWGIFAALISSSYTYFLWDHPYAILYLVAEILWLGWWLKKDKISIWFGMMPGIGE